MSYYHLHKAGRVPGVISFSSHHLFASCPVLSAHRQSVHLAHHIPALSVIYARPILHRPALCARLCHLAMPGPRAGPPPLCASPPRTNETAHIASHSVLALTSATSDSKVPATTLLGTSHGQLDVQLPRRCHARPAYSEERRRQVIAGPPPNSTHGGVVAQGGTHTKRLR